MSAPAFTTRFEQYLAETRELMAAVDAVLEEHGGWPLVGSA